MLGYASLTQPTKIFLEKLNICNDYWIKSNFESANH